MGIKNLNTLLKEHCDDAITIQPLSNWSGKRIAIDLTNIIYIHMATAWKEVVNETKVPFDEPDMDKVRSIYLSRFKQYLMRILGCKITPVIVCDGPPPPEKETITRAKRRDDRENARVRCEEFKSLLLEKDPLDIMPSDIETLRKYMRANTPVFTNDIEIVKEVCAGLGIPILQSTGEAENLCSMLCRTGRVDLVHSTDTDNIVHGCPNLVTDFTGRKYSEQKGQMVEHIKVVNFHKVLEGLRLTYTQFVDMCIMCGCDYNTNIPGIGVKTSYKLITEYNNIENLPDKYDNTCLNHVRCRELFSLRRYKELCENTEVDLNLDTDSLSTYARDALEPYGVDNWISDLVDIYRDFPKNEVNILLSPMTPIPKLVILDENSNDVNDNSAGNNNNGNDECDDRNHDSVVKQNSQGLIVRIE